MVAVTSSACALIAAIANDSPPIGFFLVNVGDIMNPIAYANGMEPQTKSMRVYRNEVFCLNDTVFVAFQPVASCTAHFVRSILEMTAAETVVVLSSMSVTKYVGNPDAPQIYTLPDKQPGVAALPAPNKVTGVAAGLLTIGILQGTDVRLFHVVESEPGADNASMALLLHAISDIVHVDVETVSQRAHRIYKTVVIDGLSVFA